MTDQANEQSTPTGRAGTVDDAEIARFSAMADAWWDPTGKFKPLHVFNPVRLAFIRDTVLRHLAREGGGLKPLEGVRLLDIGLKQAKQLDAEGPERTERNLAALDALLSPIQQAKYRVLEGEVEQRIRELMSHARAARPGVRPRNEPPRQE